MLTDNINRIRYVGTLQELGLPYSMLYVDTEQRQLYIFVRMSDGKDMRYLVTDVTAEEIESYMRDGLGLINIFSHRPYWFATVNNNSVTFDSSNNTDFKPTKRMERMNMFDPELCEDDVWIETVLSRISNNQPIEIA